MYRPVVSGRCMPALGRMTPCGQEWTYPGLLSVHKNGAIQRTVCTEMHTRPLEFRNSQVQDVWRTILYVAQCLVPLTAQALFAFQQYCQIDAGTTNVSDGAPVRSGRIRDASSVVKS